MSGFEGQQGLHIRELEGCRKQRFCLFVFLKNKFIYLFFLAALGLRCCARAFSSCGEQGLLFIAVRGLLIAVASVVEEHRYTGSVIVFAGSRVQAQ